MLFCIIIRTRLRATLRRIVWMKPNAKQAWGHSDKLMVQTIRKWIDETGNRITTDDIAAVIDSSYSRTHNVLHMRNSPFTLSQFIRICALFDKDPSTEVFKIIKLSKVADDMDTTMSDEEYDALGRFMDELTTAAENYMEAIKSITAAKHRAGHEAVIERDPQTPSF